MAYYQIYPTNLCYFSTTEMGCYGLGVTRILAAVVEVLSEGNRIRWPKLMAPYQICIIPQKVGVEHLRMFF
jgi:prolyl-tRNA synthetase